MDEPLIYTSKGNMPIKDLEYRHYRQDTPGNVVLVEEYFYQGESVKRSVHVCPLTGLSMQSEAGEVH